MQQVEVERKKEIDQILQDLKDKWDSDHRSMIEGVLRDVSSDDSRSTVIEEERNQFQQQLAQLTGDRELQDSLQQPLLGESKDGEESNVWQGSSKALGGRHHPPLSERHSAQV